MMTDRKPTPMKDRKDIVKDRKNIGQVVSPIEKLMKFRDASASCVHIEAAMEADRGLINLIKEPSHSAVIGEDPK
jgi:hypothetical protein